MLPQMPLAPTYIPEMDTDTGTVDRVYRSVKEMAASFEFKPDERLNEGVLAKRLDTSRTPLREALNRLVAEGFLTFRRGQGFFCRSLNPAEIMDLYEARAAIEAEATRLATLRASDTALDDLVRFLENSRDGYAPGASPVELIRLDEGFHMAVARLSENAELQRLLVNLTGRIHYVRLIDLQSLSEKHGPATITVEPHIRIAEAMRTRDPARAAEAMRRHIEKRVEEVTANVRTAFSRLYAP